SIYSVFVTVMLYFILLLFFFFFFQAEDGIRDDLVTGVQTCALPISVPQQRRGEPHLQRRRRRAGWRPAILGGVGRLRQRRRPGRSEERRVGKEWRWGWGRWQYEKKREKNERKVRSVEKLEKVSEMWK